MIKILLINPPFEYYSQHQIFREPLSLAYLAAYLREHYYHVEILDGVAGGVKKKGNLWRYGFSDAEINRKIRDLKPDVIGITCLSSLRIFDVLKLARLIKRIDSRIITVTGGVHPTVFPKDTVSQKEIDYVIVGEGEEAFFQLIKNIEAGKKLPGENVDGCAYKTDKQIIVNEKTKFIRNLDSLPLPARDLLPMEFYFKNGTVLYGVGGKRAATILTSRSCPMKCTFCSVHLIQGQVLRMRSAENVFLEIEELVNKYGVEEILILDDNLTFNRKRVVKLCKMILQKKLKLRWNTPNGIRADRIDAHLVKLMKQAGCVNVCIGVEAGNDRVRNEIIRKSLARESIEKALKVCAKVGLPVTGFFILGIPGETEETFKDTIEMVKKMPFSMISTFFFVPIAGTKLYNDCVRNGFINRDYWKKVHRFTRPIVRTPDFDEQTLKKWEKEIYFAFFKSHFWSILYQTLTLKNQFLKPGLVKRFLFEKFGVPL